MFMASSRSSCAMNQLCTCQHDWEVGIAAVRSPTTPLSAAPNSEHISTCDGNHTCLHDLICRYQASVFPMVLGWPQGRLNEMGLACDGAFSELCLF